MQLFRKCICIIAIVIVLLAIVHHSMYSNLRNTFKDVGPFYSFGPNNIGAYLMGQQNMDQGLDPYYSTILNPKYRGTVLDPNSVRALEGFVTKTTRPARTTVARITRPARTTVPITTRPARTTVARTTRPARTKPITRNPTIPHYQSGMTEDVPSYTYATETTKYIN